MRKVGVNVAKSTVEKYMVRHRKPSPPTWRSFLENHVGDLVSIDFFVVPTVSFKLLFVLIFLAHERRQIVYFNLTEHPSEDWTARQFLEAFPWEETPRYMLRDRGLDLWRTFPWSRREHRDQGSRDRPAKPVAESVCRTRDRKASGESVSTTSFVLGESHLKRTLSRYFAY